MNVVGLDVVGQWSDIPLRVFDVDIQGNGRMADDFVVVQAGRAYRGNSGLGDAKLEDNFLSLCLCIFAALDGRSKRGRSQNQILMGVKM